MYSGVMVVGTDVDGMTPLEVIGGVPLDDPVLPLFISSTESSTMVSTNKTEFTRLSYKLAS